MVKLPGNSKFPDLVCPHDKKDIWEIKKAKSEIRNRFFFIA
jgi:hypothetical protein